MWNLWNWMGNRPQAPDPENGTSYTKAERPTDGGPRTGGEQFIDDDTDNNDKFWKLFVEEAIKEAKWQVSIWKTELDSLLVFAGLFAGVVSAFLVDLRSHLRPDPQVIALKDIASILRNVTSPDVERPPNPVVIAGALWYGSLVVTLIGALLGVLAKGWLGKILRETPNNPADRALERWRRDEAARHWYMDKVITGVPLLVQCGLAMFLIGFVVQSFDDYRNIGLQVLVYVILGACAYALLTVSPLRHPDCPYRTPLTDFYNNFFHLIRPELARTVIGKDDHDANTESKIKILMSRLNRSSNDEIFCSAAAMLDAKLESDDSEKWYKGVVLQEKAHEIAEALSVRLKSFAHRVQAVPEGSLSILKDTASSGSANGQALVGALYSPIEQGVACLRIFLKSIEASMSPEGNKSPWLKKDIDRQWRLSKTFPETWRLLTLSIHITRLVARKVDYKDDIVAIDWENLIHKTFSDLTLRSISGASACRGLLHGEDNLKRVCALGLAMFIEIEATGLPKQIFFDQQLAVEKGKVITEKLWNELVKMWKDAVVQLLGREVHEWDEPENSLIDSGLLEKKLYQSDIESLISKTIFAQLENKNRATRKQAVRMLTKLSDLDVFQEAMKTSGVIPKVITMLEDDDDDLRVAVINGLSTFGEQVAFTEIMIKERALPQLITTLTAEDSDVQAAVVAVVLKFSSFDNELYQNDVESSIPTMLKHLEHTNWSIRENTVQILTNLSGLDVYDEVMNTAGTIQRIVATLKDGDSDVRAAAVAALQTFSRKELYEDNIKLSIPTIITQLDDETCQWTIRQQNIQILLKLSENDAFGNTINEGAIPQLVARLEDDDSDVRAAAVETLQAFSRHELYQNNIKSSIPTIMKQLDHDYWRISQKAVEMLAQLFTFKEFRETLNTEEMILKIFAKLKDHDSDVCAAAVAALQGFSNDESYYSDLELSVPTIVAQLDDENWKIRQQAIGMLKMFSKSDVFQETLKTNGVITKLIAMLSEDKDEDVRVAAVEAVSILCTNDYFEETMNTGNNVSKLSDRLLDDDSSVRLAAFQAMSILSTHGTYNMDIKSKVSVINVVKQLEDELSWSTRQRAVQTLSQFATIVDFQVDMNTEKTVSKVANMLTGDNDDDVRTASAKALSVFGAQESLQKAFKSEKVISKLAAKLSDSFSNVRNAVQSTMLALSTQAFHQNDIKAAIPTLMGQLENSSWAVRQQVIQTVEKLSEQTVFQETLKTEGFITKLVARLKDTDEDVRAAAAHALSMLGTKDTFKEKMMVEKAIPKLLAQITDNHDTARNAVHDALLALGKQENVIEFLQTVVSTLNTVDKPVRTALYKLLTELKDARAGDFLDEIDTAICELLIQMKDKDISFIRSSIAILTETMDEGLRGDNLQTPDSANRSARDAVETVVRSKLGYEKNSPDPHDVVLTLSRLAKHDVFVGCMRPAIPALIEAVGSNDRNTSNAIKTIANLSTQGDFRADLVPAVQKLVQKLSVWDDDEAYPLDLIRALSTLAQYKEFQNKLKHVVPILMEKLQKDLRNKTLDQESDKNKVAFYQEACKLICKLCEETVGRDLVPHLTPVLSNMHASLTEDLLDVVTNLINNGNLTMNDRIALASSLRILSSVPDSLEVQVCKLTIAALLDDAHSSDPEDTEYSAFLGAVLGDSNNSNIKSKLSMLIPPAATA